MPIQMPASSNATARYDSNFQNLHNSGRKIEFQTPWLTTIFEWFHMTKENFSSNDLYTAQGGESEPIVVQSQMLGIVSQP
jgi:hypothetical protein